MTFYDDEGWGPELRLRIEGHDHYYGDYIKIMGQSRTPPQGDHNNNNNNNNSTKPEEQRSGGQPETPSSASPPKRTSFWYWVKLGFLLVFLGLLAGVFLHWVGPYAMNKVIIPIINWETKKFSAPVLAIVIFASVALFPTLLIPSTPSMWVAGMVFGYGYGFLLIISGVAIGVSLPYLIGYAFHPKIQGWLEKYPKKASILRSAGEGNWFHQFRAVTLIRISPFPYIIFNYCAVATNVKYGPYVLGSLVGIVPEIFVAIYTGILIRTLADASHKRQVLSVPQIIFNVLGFCGTLATTIFITIYAKRRLKELQIEEEPLLQ